MNKDTVNKIFSIYDLGDVTFIKRIEVGFTNIVYSIDDRYILKICENEKNEINFEKEVFLCKFLRDVVPAPSIIVYDDTKKYLDKHFIIYPKIEGDNLYAKWHVMNTEQRRDMIKQLCVLLKKINAIDYRPFVQNYDLPVQIEWREVIDDKIKRSLQKISVESILEDSFIIKIKKFVKKNMNVLMEQEIALVYWDAHFDNILVRDDKIIGILDFERTELASIDFMLDTIKRMVDQPKKYMSAASEKYAKREDYAHLLTWFEEFYPELFNFSNMRMRLKLYAIEHDLSDISRFSHVPELERQVAKMVGYDKL